MQLFCSQEDEVMGEVQINLDEIPQDELIDRWYAVAFDEGDLSFGCIKIRLLLSSQPTLADKTNSWLLEDFQLLEILQTANDLVASKAAKNWKIIQVRNREQFRVT